MDNSKCPDCVDGWVHFSSWSETHARRCSTCKGTGKYLKVKTMGETKERQWAVLHMKDILVGKVKVPMVQKITWFDARQQARDFVKAKFKPGRGKTYYDIKPMTRGPRA